MLKTIAITAAALLAAALGGTYVAGMFAPGSDDQFAACRASNVGSADIGGPFELVDENGVTVTQDDVITGPTLIYFGYTFCPDICPTDNMRNAMAIDLTDEMGVDVAPVFISIDPERDTPERLQDFTDAFHERMLGLTGSLEQVQAASRAYKTYYSKEDTDDEFYLVDHTTMSYLVLPDEGFVEFYRRDISPEAMAESLACFVDAAG